MKTCLWEKESKPQFMKEGRQTIAYKRRKVHYSLWKKKGQLQFLNSSYPFSYGHHLLWIFIILFKNAFFCFSSFYFFSITGAITWGHFCCTHVLHFPSTTHLYNKTLIFVWKLLPPWKMYIFQFHIHKACKKSVAITQNYQVGSPFPSLENPTFYRHAYCHRPLHFKLNF